MTHQHQRVVLVTGGGRGIGAATARLAAARGWDVAVNYTRDQASAQAVADSVRDAGRRAVVVRADVADPAAVQAMFLRVDSELGRLTDLVNNAGIVDAAMRFDEMSLTRLRRMLDVNVLGTMLCAQQAIRRISTRHGGPGGSIVNISSAAARLGSPGVYVDYAAAKGAVDVLTLGLGKELAAEGVRVNAVRPGIVDTEIHADSGDPDRARTVGPSLPMGRVGRPEEIAAAVVWLMSPEASYLTASVVDVAGGR
ncbi:MAG: SDR family oxidoreductase [Kineosporiaceae bacterium]|nr:SDR family oxidoreductase [Kineosporiaceae bacterium]